MTQLLVRVREVGRLLVKAQPREFVIENIVRRVLGLIREVATGDHNDTDTNMSDMTSPPSRDGSSLPLNFTGTSLMSHSDLGISLDGLQPPVTSEPRRPQMSHSQTTAAAPTLARSTTSMFWFFSQAETESQTSTQATNSPAIGSSSIPLSAKLILQHGAFHDIRAIKLDALEGIRELLDEIDQASEQVADQALTYINANDTVLVQGGSTTIYKFLHTAASKKRKFTVFVVDGSPNNSTSTRNQILTGSRHISPLTKSEGADATQDRTFKPLAALGVNVVLIPDSAVFAIMSYVNKVLIAPHVVLSSGGLLATVGASSIAAAARAHKVPVLSLSGVYKLSPKDTFNPTLAQEIGDAGALGGSEDLWEGIEVVNPLWDYVKPEIIDLYITNM